MGKVCAKFSRSSVLLKKKINKAANIKDLLRFSEGVGS
jgi:hypothetical protein